MNHYWHTDAAILQAERIVRSHRLMTGRELFPEECSGFDRAQRLFEAAFVVVSHDTEPDPVLNYGNATALSLWDMSWEQFTKTPSRFTAEAPNREERARLLASVASRGYIDDYSGVRVTSSGRRFQIAKATVWNLVTDTGAPCGQAATFSHWHWLK